MTFYIDLDNTIVTQHDRDYGDVTTPLQFLPGAREALLALKAAGHVLVLWSARASRAMLYNPDLDPLVRCGVRKPEFYGRKGRDMALNWARYDQMLAFVAAELPGVFDAISDGSEGKPCGAQFIDDRSLQSLHTAAQYYGETALP